MNVVAVVVVVVVGVVLVVLVIMVVAARLGWCLWSSLVDSCSCFIFMMALCVSRSPCIFPLLSSIIPLCHFPGHDRSDNDG